MNHVDNAIYNLESTRDALLRLSEADKNYNTSWGVTLNLMGWSLHRHAQELKENKYNFGGLENV